MTCPSRERPATACRTLGVADFIRLPSPAARMTTTDGRLLVTSVPQSGRGGRGRQANPIRSPLSLSVQLRTVSQPPDGPQLRTRQRGVAGQLVDRETRCMTDVEVTASHEAQVGQFTVRRALPRRGRRTVGAWCFADHMGPADVTEGSGLDVGPHPHMGLQTVTWLLDGQALHKDTLGSEQVIAPGQLNLMTAGRAVAHAEEATGHYRGTLEGIQLWIALPEATRNGTAAFEHHAELPRCDLDGASGHRAASATSPAPAARHATTPRSSASTSTCARPPPCRLRPDFEYALVVMRGAVAVDGHAGDPGAPRLPRARARRGPPRRHGAGAGDPARRSALRRAPADVVELRRPHPGRDRRRLRVMARPG